jgi:hypothetical protein
MVKMNKVIFKYILVTSCSILALTTFGHAAEKDLKICEDEAVRFGDGHGEDLISQKCYLEFKNLVPDKSKKNTANGLHTVFGYRNLIVIEKKDSKGAIIDVNVIAGVSTLLVAIQAVSIDEKNNEIVVLEASGDVLFFSSILTGNIAPFRILRNKELYGATNLVTDSNKDEVIVYLPSAGQLLFFSRTANFHGRKGKKNLNVLRSFEDISAAINKMSIDNNKKELLLEDVDKKIVHKISL